MTREINPEKLNEFVGKTVGDLGAALSAVLVVIGDKLGLFKAMADGAPVTPQDLAARTDTTERYVREWLAAMAAAGYVSYDRAVQRYSLTPEQAEAFTNDESPACVAGGFQAMVAAMRAEPKITAAFKSGAGVGWHEHDPGLFCGTERFFRPGYNANLVSNWIPALNGVQEKLERGGKVADVGCGHGASTVMMAKAFPRSIFHGFDYHLPSIETARQRAAEAGVADRVTFAVASAQAYPGTGYDLVACFDCLHDMGDPIGAAAHVLQTLDGDGSWLLVEPFAHDDVADNLNPVGRLFYSASTMICTPASLAQDVGHGLGAQAGEARLRDVVTRGGDRKSVV